ncbi:DUF397 domain-containing protein [Embleya hyalina]|uniref:DUF397 domain-containing protein n=1 Tax=Embleya hyalina TaxID=516124 RepID=A0A401Z6B4_9ACTN|nr:DUF397 domain-containing protein [Embleya hyalina]GCE02379.1 DUF397 domain-containing protein [Embleya hyalina]
MNIDNFAWRKASRSTGNQSCVEVAPLPTSTGVRDTKDRRRGHLQISPAAWIELLRGLRG